MMLVTQSVRRLISWFGRPEDLEVRDAALRVDEANRVVLSKAEAECRSLRAATEVKCQAVMDKAKEECRQARGDLEYQVDRAYAASWRGARARFDGVEYWVEPAHEAKTKCPDPLDMSFEGRRVRCATCADICPTCGIVIKRYHDYKDCNCTSRGSRRFVSVALFLSTSLAWIVLGIIWLLSNHEPRFIAWIFGICLHVGVGIVIWGEMNSMATKTYDYGWRIPTKVWRSVDKATYAALVTYWFMLSAAFASCLAFDKRLLLKVECEVGWIKWTAMAAGPCMVLVVWRFLTYPPIQKPTAS